MNKDTGQIASQWLLRQQIETFPKRHTNTSKPQPEPTAVVRVGAMKPFAVTIQL